MTLEDIEKKMDTIRRDVANYHTVVLGRYSALDGRLDSVLADARKSKWTPVILFLYSGVLVWMGAALERWL